MMMIKKYLACVLSLIFVPILAQSPESFRLKGTITDEFKLPLEYAAIYLEDDSSKVVYESASNANGAFELRAASGNYTLILETIGMKQLKKKISVTANADLGVFVLISAEIITLEGAVITAEKPVYRVELDKKVYDLASDPIAKGGSLSEALENVPSLQVDSDGNVSIRGSDNVRILIDGKPSGMLGVSSVGEALKNISAESVERIEVVTNPSARYEASGAAGVVNIVLKKGSNQGLNGSFTISGGIPESVGVSTNLNYRTNKYNIFSNLSYRYSENKMSSDVSNVFFKNGLVSETRLEDGKTDMIRRNYRFQLGGEYYLDTKNTFTLSAAYGKSNRDSDAAVYYNTFDVGGSLLEASQRFQKEKTLDNDISGDFSFKHEFKEGHEFVVSARASFAESDRNAFTNEYQDISKKEETSYNYEKVDSYLISADYVQPVGEKGKFELGARGDMTSTDTNYGVNVLDLLTGNWNPKEDYTANVVNQQNIYSAYTQFGQTFGNLSVFAGVRMENSVVTIKSLLNDVLITKDYTDFFPSATLGYEFNKKNQLQLSYSRRIQRPRTWQLLPFHSSSNDKSIMVGNPDLNPMYTNSIELSYITNIGKLMITPNLYYSRTTDFIRFHTSLKEIEGENVFQTQPLNIGTEDRYGVDLTFTYRPVKWWNMMGNINVFGYDSKGKYEDNGLITSYDGDGLRWFGRYSSTFTMPADFKLQLTGNYMQGMKTEQSRVKDMYGVDLGLTKDFLKGNATLTFNVRDVFNTRKRDVYSYGEEFTTHRVMRRGKTTFNLSFSYRFKQTKKQDRQNNNNNNNSEDSDGFM